MDPSSYHTVKASRAYTYSYYISPVKKERGTIVLLHGFPEYADMWADQIKVFENLGYTCIAPDLLGYGGTSKPTDTEAYNSEGQSQDIADIMETVGVQNAIFIGHDWGCYLAGRFAVWQPEKIAGLVLTNVSYRPAAKLDLAVVNRAMVATFGYEVFGFWKWISSADAPKLLGSHVESLFSLLFAKDAEIWQTDFTPTGGLEKWLTADRRVAEADFMSPTLKATLIERWKSEGFDAKLGWYRAMTENVNWEHEQKIASFELSIPVLFIGGSRDAACPARLGELFTKPLCKDYTGVIIDSCHWMLRERPVQWLETVKPWLLSRF